jgi:hypothetical protein
MHSLWFDDITPRCDTCNRRRIASHITASSELLKAAWDCAQCEDTITLDFSIRNHQYVNDQSAFRLCDPVSNILWNCANGCGWGCDVERLEMGDGVARISFRCSLCRTSVRRQYDLKQLGYIDVSGILAHDATPRMIYNHFRYVGSRPCVNRMECPFQSVRDLVKIDVASFSIERLAGAVHGHCPNMNQKQIGHCTCVLFGEPYKYGASMWNAYEARVASPHRPLTLEIGETSSTSGGSGRI